jgi:hypothetical protein
LSGKENIRSSDERATKSTDEKDESNCFKSKAIHPIKLKLMGSPNKSSSL